MMTTELVDLLYKRGIITEKHWKRLFVCLLSLDGLKLEGKFSEEASEYVDEIIEILCKTLLRKSRN